MFCTQHPRVPLVLGANTSQNRDFCHDFEQGGAVTMNVYVTDAHIGRHGAAEGHLAALAKVDNLDGVVVAKHNVLRLQIAVDDATPVQIIAPAGELAAELCLETLGHGVRAWPDDVAGRANAVQQVLHGPVPAILRNHRQGRSC